MAEEIKRIGTLPDGLQPAGQPSQAPAAGKPRFGEVLGQIVSEVDSLHKKAEHTTDKLITGELEDVHQVVVAMEEAQTSFRLLMEIRNKMVDAYKEIMRTQV